MKNTPFRIFIAYARKDAEYLEELRLHLRPLERSHRVKVWYDGEIEPGTVWAEAIKKHLHEADLILLLVSAQAIASDYFYEKEVADALERHSEGKARVVSLILRPCDWMVTPLADLQALPKDGKPVTSWVDRDAAYADVAISLRKMVEDWEENKSWEEKKTIETPVLQEHVPTERFKKAAEPRHWKKAVGFLRPKNRDPFQDLMVKVDGGTFKMGEEKGMDFEKPVHSVRVKDFFISKFPVTQRQWVEIMSYNPSHFQGCDDCPVECVSWRDTQPFFEKLRQMTGTRYRLPTEAEWEFAAKGGNLSRGFKYAGSNTLDEVGWYDENSEDKTHPVGLKKPNELGLYDMCGNVLEWVEDKWHDNFEYAPDDGSAWLKREYMDSRVNRGGAHSIHLSYCRSASRSQNWEGHPSRAIGFRVAASAR